MRDLTQYSAQTSRLRATHSALTALVLGRPCQPQGRPTPTVRGLVAACLLRVEEIGAWDEEMLPACSNASAPSYARAVQNDLEATQMLYVFPSNPQAPGRRRSPQR